MSHEIRTPLNAIMGLAQLLEEGELRSEERGLIQQISESGQSLLRIINDILDFSKIEAGQLQMESHPFNPVQSLRNVLHLFQPLAKTKALDLRLELAEGDLPPAVMGDRLRLEQILINLVSNAIKFTERGEIVASLRSLSSDGASRLRFEVKDTGIGIAPEALANLFQAFSQADMTITRRYGGTGLGLAISRRLVALMGGDIGVNSLAGHGSNFWFEIPCERSAEQGECPESIEPEEVERMDVADLQGLRVLAVDDNRINLLLVERARVSLASDGQQALDTLKTAPGDFDVILMDVQMPVMDGLAATREIRRIPELVHLPVIALSAGVLPEERAAAFSAGFTGFLAKPIDIKQMRDLLHSIRGKRRADPD